MTANYAGDEFCPGTSLAEIGRTARWRRCGAACATATALSRSAGGFCRGPLASRFGAHMRLRHKRIQVRGHAVRGADRVTAVAPRADLGAADDEVPRRIGPRDSSLCRSRHLPPLSDPAVHALQGHERCCAAPLLGMTRARRAPIPGRRPRERGAGLDRDALRCGDAVREVGGDRSTLIWCPPRVSHSGTGMSG